MRIFWSPSRRKSFTAILAPFISSRILILLVGWLSNLVVLKSTWYGNPQSVLDLFFRWDSGWYLAIVQNGYFYVPGVQSSVAFFPLYPLLVKIFSLSIADPRITGIVISNVALFLAVIYLFKLIRLDYEDENIALNAVVFILIFPTSFFLSIFYSESLFLFLSLVCFYYARKHRWFLSSLAGYFAALTRSLGVFILIPILIEYLTPTSPSNTQLARIKKDILWLLLIPAGLLSYMFYLYVQFKEPLAFLKAESAWSRGFSLSLSTLMSIFTYDPFYAAIFGGFTVASISLVIYLVHRRARLSYVIYVAVQLFFVFTSGIIESLPRYLCVLFPLFLEFGLIARNKLWGDALKLFSISLLTLFVILFANGYWLA
jgi:Gpi18-like mannosyltransferase